LFWSFFLERETIVLAKSLVLKDTQKPPTLYIHNGIHNKGLTFAVDLSFLVADSSGVQFLVANGAVEAADVPAAAGSNNLLGHEDSSSTLGTPFRAAKLPSSSSSPCPSRLPIAGPSSCACGGEVR
jgi:hypothetical protein